jgi:pyruvate-ferredoxin/flavodoxin oxidoreductase
MAQFGKAQKGKEEIRKEIGLIAMAHRTAFVMQGSISNTSHLIEGLIQGLNQRGPALFNIYTPCMPEHGIGDDAAEQQARMAVESRAYPLFRYNPNKGITPTECFDLDGNPAPNDTWTTHTLNYVDENNQPATMQTPLTFADFAATEGRFRKHFREAPQSQWNENMMPIADYLELAGEEREGKYPYIRAVDGKNRLMRLMVSDAMIHACEERRQFWTLLKALAGPALNVEQTEGHARTEVVQKPAAGLLAEHAGAAAPATAPSPATVPETTSDGHVPPWIDSKDCTACGECIAVNPKIFQFNDKKQAYIADPKGGSFKDLVKAAERCPAQIIHPGHPGASAEKGIDKLIERAKKFA